MPSKFSLNRLPVPAHRIWNRLVSSPESSPESRMTPNLLASRIHPQELQARPVILKISRGDPLTRCLRWV